jgi:hypothetical protein
LVAADQRLRRVAPTVNHDDVTGFGHQHRLMQQEIVASANPYRQSPPAERHSQIAVTRFQSHGADMTPEATPRTGTGIGRNASMVSLSNPWRGLMT